MKKQCKSEKEGDLDKLLGLGDNSVRKSYYPILQDKINTLNEKENNLRIIFNGSYDAIIILDFNGNILDVNDTMLKIFRCEKHQALTWRAETLIDTSFDRNIFQNYWSRAIKGEYVTFEWTSKRPLENELFPVDVVLCCIKWNGSDVVMANIRDITEKVIQRKALEDAMHQLELMNAKLEYTVDERTEQLKNTQMELIQREKMASIGQLAAGVAHEINNPLGFIMSNVDTLKKYTDIYVKLLSAYKEMAQVQLSNIPDEYIDLYKNVKLFEEKNKIDFINNDISALIDESLDGLERISKIVRGLRDFARVDTSQDFTEYDLNQGIQSTIQIAHNSIKYNAQVKLELAEIPIIRARGNEINQVVLNLLINAAHAIKASNKQGVIRIRTYQDEGSVVLEIEDDGTGISNINLMKIFDPFYTTKPIGEGTGLGLSIAYDMIVNKHKGEIDVKSELGKGTIFIIKIPINSNPCDDE